MTESQVNFCNASQINVQISSFTLTKPSELHNREHREGKASLREVLQAHVHFSPFSGQESHSPHASIKYGG